MKRIALLCAVLVALVAGYFVLPVCAEEPTASERVVAIKAHLAESEAILHQYEWLETTIVSVDRMEKFCSQQRVSYDADGAVRKVPVLYGSATFARETVLEAKKKKLIVSVINSEYRKITP